MEESKNTEKIALFVDLENFIGFSDDLRLPFELEPVIKKLTEAVGKVLFRRSFGDITQALNAIGRTQRIRDVRRMLQENLVRHEDLPYDSGYKNSSDMRLAVDALSVAFNYSDITTFAFVSGDRDYIPLFNRLRELNKNVVGISGSEATVSDRYRFACDAVFYVEDLYKSQSGFLAEITPQAEDSDFTSLRDQYLDLLTRAVASLNFQGKKSTGGNLRPQMNRMQSDFDPARAGFDSFKDFVAFAQEKGVIQSEPSGGDFYVTLPGTQRPVQRAVTVSVSDNLTEVYRNFIESKMRQPLPSREMREKIYHAAARQIEFSRGYISLSDLSHDVTDDLTVEGYPVPQSVAFKLLYTLHRARCFVVQDGHDSYDPRIVGTTSPAERWDEKFIANVVLLMRREMGHATIIARNLTELFYETTESDKFIEEVIQRSWI